MKRLRSWPVAAISLAAASLFLAGIAPDLDAALQGPPAGAGQEPGARGGRGRGAGRGGGGRGAANTLGEGPWDLETETGTVHLTLVTGGLDHPWGIAFLPNGDMLVTERAGRLRVIRNGMLDPTPLEGLPEIRAVSLGGLMDITLHPDFEDNQLIYFTYSKPDTEDPTLSTTAVARARYDGGPALENLEDVFVADSWYSGAMSREFERCCGQGPADASYGSRIVFDDDGFMYVTIGDRNWGERSQDPSTHIGKIVRLHDDGSVPDDNPFVGMDGYKPEIYSLGHRNPLGLTVHPLTGELWETEFGPEGGDELNKIEAGKNYGWILVTNGNHYNGEPAALGKSSVAGMEDPVLFWGPPSINPGNLTFYHGDKLPEWEGQMLMGAMSRTVLRATFDANGNVVGQERMFGELNQRYRDTRTGPDAYVYLLTDETAGAVLRIDSID